MSRRDRIRKSIHNHPLTGILFCLLLAVFGLYLSSGFPGDAAADKGLVINEVVSSNSHSLVDPVLGSPDWVELYNPGSTDVSLAGYRLTDKKTATNGDLVSGTVPAGGYLVIYAQKGGKPAGSQICVDYNLNKGSESLYLISPANTVICQVDVPELMTDESYAQRADGTYGCCSCPTPGKANDDAAIQDQSKMRETLNAEQLDLNEVLPKAADGDTWAELYNPGNTDIELSDFFLTDNQGDTTKWHLPQGKLAAGQYAVVHFAQKDGSVGSYGMEATFRLGSQDTAVYLYDLTGRLAGSLSWQLGLPEGSSVLPGGKYTAQPTQGAANSDNTFSSIVPAAMDASDPVRISEALPKNQYGITDSEKAHCDWVELHNSSPRAVSLVGYYLSDNQDKPLKWAFPDTATIDAGGYLVVMLSGEGSNPTELHAPFSLSSEGTGVYLTNRNGLRVDTLPLPGSIGADIAVGRDAAGALQYYAHPTPGSQNSAGVADLASIGCFDNTGVYISEACAANKPGSKANDWIELHNGGSAAVDLTGYYLSDKPDNPKLWQIPALTIEAGGYAVIEATSDTSRQHGAVATFGISPQGETLLLSDKQGAVLDVFQSGTLKAGITSGRLEGDNRIPRVYFSTPTPGQPNAQQYTLEYTATPSLSQTGLYQSSPFQLTMSCATPQAEIFYTTDGSVPTNKSKAYNGPVAVSRNTPIRAIAYSAGNLPSNVATETYLFDAPHTLPVFCINGQPGQINVLLTTDKMGYKPEYPCTAAYYETDGTMQAAFPCGIRPKGNMSLIFPQNSVTMVLSDAYGQKNVTYPFFPDSKTTTFAALTLRDSGQDYNAARMRDSFFQRISAGLDVETIDTKPVVVYMNGQYCGLYDLTEEQDDSYLETLYGLNQGNIDRINRNDRAQSGNNKEFLRVNNFAESQNMANDTKFAELAKVVDIDACTDWLVEHTYWADGDLINLRFWRARDYSIKWRPFLFDLDFSMQYNNVNRNRFGVYLDAAVPGPDNPIVDKRILCALMKNKAWRDKFVQRFIQLAYTDYSPDRILPIFDSMVNAMAPEMPLHIARWHTPGSLSVWQSETAALRNVVANRRAVALKQLQQYFHVPQATMQQYIAQYSAAQ